MASSSPMIILTDFSDSSGFVQHGVYQAGTGGYGVWDARLSYSGLTKQIFEARTPVQAVQAVQFACKHALTGDRGPVAVIFSAVSLAGDVGPASEPRLYATDSYLPPPPPPARQADVDAAVALVGAAERPVIIAGNGVRISQAYDQLARFADRLNVPLATTAGGKGCFPEVHDLALGVFGNFGVSTANAGISEADLILAVGTKLGASDTARENPKLLDAARQTFIQLDIEPLNAAWTFPTSNVLIGDAGAILDQLTEAASGVDGDGRARVAGLRGRLGYFDNAAGVAETVPIRPERAIAEIQRAVGEDTIVTCDAGENRLFMTHFFQTRAIETFVMAPGVGPMGYAIPSALALKLLHPDRAVVAVAGDGGFPMTMNGLLSAIEYELPIVVVVLNNAALGWVVSGGSMPADTPWRDFNFAEMGRGMGCHGLRIEKPGELEPALREALRRTERPTVLDVRISMETSFLDVTSPLVWKDRG
jgi:acetolactate synthase I/II/III large subunit